MKDVILEARKAKNLTQQGLAELVGVTQPTVCQWENGIVTPSVPTIKRLSEVLEIPVEKFFNTEET